MKQFRYLLVMVITTLCLVSCDYKELCYDHNHYTTTRVMFDWKKIPDADVKGMTVLFYNLDKPDTEPIRYDFNGMTGGSAQLTPGNYRILAYNYDTETILYRGNDDYQTLEAYTRNSSIEEGTELTRSEMPRATGTEEEAVILEPDILYGATSSEVTIPYNDSSEVTLYPERRYKTITITIDNVPNLNYTGTFGGSLSGLAGSVMMASGTLSDICVTQAFKATKVGTQSLRMEFRIFGHCPHAIEGTSNQHKLTIYAVLADNSKWYYTVDLTDKIHEAEQKQIEEHKDDPEYEIGSEDISITLEEGVPIPKPIVNGSGFQPSVDGWQSIEVDVKM